MGIPSVHDAHDPRRLQAGGPLQAAPQAQLTLWHHGIPFAVPHIRGVLHINVRNQRRITDNIRPPYDTPLQECGQRGMYPPCHHHGKYREKRYIIQKRKW